MVQSVLDKTINYNENRSLAKDDSGYEATMFEYELNNNEYHIFTTLSSPMISGDLFLSRMESGGQTHSIFSGLFSAAGNFVLVTPWPCLKREK